MPHAYAPYTSIARNFSFIMNLLTDKAPAFWNKMRILLLFWEKRYLIMVLDVTFSQYAQFISIQNYWYGNKKY